MTHAEIYRAALEAAAKVNDQEADKLRDAAEKFKHAGAHFKAKEALYCKWALRHKAKAIRALPVPEDGDIDQERIVALKAEIARCHARLEIDHLFRLEDGKLVRFEVPMADRLLIPDAVECRDATIGEFDRQRQARKDMVMVPREPTEKMIEAANREWDGRMSARSAGVWNAMIEAAGGKP